MKNYIIKRFFLTLPTLAAILVLNFILASIAPGNPVEIEVSKIRFSDAAGRGIHSEATVSKQVIKNLTKQYGLDQPIHIRFFLWLKKVSTLDLGASIIYQAPVANVIFEALPISFTFGALSFVISYFICTPLGVYQATHCGFFWHRLSNFFLYTTYAIPPVVLGLFLIYFLAIKWSFFPIGEFQSDNSNSLSIIELLFDRAWHMVLPVICYTAGGLSALTSLMRGSFLDVLKQDFVRTARSKGLSEGKVLFKHVLRNAAIPLAVGLGVFLGSFFTGSIFVESLFNIHGIGHLAYQALTSRDYNLLMGLCLLSSLALIGGRIASDIICVLLDPRIDFN